MNKFTATKTDATHKKSYHFLGEMNTEINRSQDCIEIIVYS